MARAQHSRFVLAATDVHQVMLPLRRDVGALGAILRRIIAVVICTFSSHFVLDRPTGHLSTKTEVRLSTPALKSDPVAVHCRSSRVRKEVHVPLAESLTERQRVVRHQVSGTRSRASR